MADFSSDIVIIGAGLLGLAIARTLSEQGKEVLVAKRTSSVKVGHDAPFFGGQ